MAVNASVVRDAIVTELQTAGAQNVYKEDPKLVDWESVIDNLRQEDSQFIQCWTVRRVASEPHTSETDYGRVPIGCAVFWHHTFRVMMFFGYIENSSEEQMQTLIDNVLTHFQVLRTFGELVFGVARPLTLTGIEPRELGGLGGWEASFTIMTEVHEYGLTPV